MPIAAAIELKKNKQTKTFVTQTLSFSLVGSEDFHCVCHMKLIIMALHGPPQSSVDERSRNQHNLRAGYTNAPKKTTP